MTTFRQSIEICYYESSVTAALLGKLHSLRNLNLHWIFFRNPTNEWTLKEQWRVKKRLRYFGRNATSIGTYSYRSFIIWSQKSDSEMGKSCNQKKPLHYKEKCCVKDHLLPLLRLRIRLLFTKRFICCWDILLPNIF